MEGRSLPTHAVAQNGANRGTTPTDSQLTRSQHHVVNWVEETRGSLMIVATVTATLTFQIAINPPGGVWQADTSQQQAGTSVLASGDTQQKSRYEIFILLCTISFSASQSVILFLLTGFTLRNRLVTWLLTVVMCVSVVCLSGAYVISMLMVMHPLDKTLSRITQYYTVFWGGLVCLLGLVLLWRFLFWLVKRLCRLLCCCCCRGAP